MSAGRAVRRRDAATAMGTLAWAERREGALDRPETLLLAGQAVLAQLAGLPGTARARLSRRGPRGPAGYEEPRVPDGRLAREALELARDAYPAPLLAHCLRCWLWGDLFARIGRIGYDAELLYVSALLHDLAITDAHRPPPGGPAACFAVHGGAVARDLLLARDADEPFATAVAEAITLHMNVRVPPALGVEAHLLHAAAHLDVAGSRAGELPPAAVRHVLGRHPRHGFPVLFGQQMRREATERPRSRAALLWRLGMRLPLEHNPLGRWPDQEPARPPGLRPSRAAGRRTRGQDGS